MVGSDQTRSRNSLAGFGDFVGRNRDEILHSWIAAVDQHPSVSSSDKLTYTQLLDHLPELCTELAALLKRPDAQSIKREAKDDARAHGWKRWHQGYKLDELIREMCLVRRDFVDNWLYPFAAENREFDVHAHKEARRIVDGFFDTVIIEATVQYVQQRDEVLHRRKPKRGQAKRASVMTRAELIHFVSHRMREPLGPLFFALELLSREESISLLGLDMVRALKTGIEQEARAIEELLTLIEVWTPEEVHHR